MGQIIDLSHFSIWLLILSICKGFALFTIIHTLYKDKFNSFITLITTLISISTWNLVNQYSKLLAEKADNSAFVILSYVSLILFIFAVFAISIDTKTKKQNHRLAFDIWFVYFYLDWQQCNFEFYLEQSRISGFN